MYVEEKEGNNEGKNYDDKRGDDFMETGSGMATDTSMETDTGMETDTSLETDSCMETGISFRYVHPTHASYTSSLLSLIKSYPPLESSQ